MIIRDVLASQLRNYLQHRPALAELLDWAGLAMMESEFDDPDLENDPRHHERLGTADVRECGLAWEDCEDGVCDVGVRGKI